MGVGHYHIAAGIKLLIRLKCVLWILPVKCGSWQAGAGHFRTVVNAAADAISGAVISEASAVSLAESGPSTVVQYRPYCRQRGPTAGSVVLLQAAWPFYCCSVQALLHAAWPYCR